MNTAEHITLANPAAWCTSASPGGATYGVFSSSAFARAIIAAGLGAGSAADSPDWAGTVVSCCAWAPVTTSANKNAITRIKYVLLVLGALAQSTGGQRAGLVGLGLVVWMRGALTSRRF